MSEIVNESESGSESENGENEDNPQNNEESVTSYNILVPVPHQFQHTENIIANQSHLIKNNLVTSLLEWNDCQQSRQKLLAPLHDFNHIIVYTSEKMYGKLYEKLFIVERSAMTPLWINFYRKIFSGFYVGERTTNVLNENEKYEIEDVEGGDGEDGDGEDGVDCDGLQAMEIDDMEIDDKIIGETIDDKVDTIEAIDTIDAVNSVGTKDDLCGWELFLDDSFICKTFLYKNIKTYWAI